MPAVRTHNTSIDLLEVKTGMDAHNSSLPRLSIIAPTPRTFSFPTSHNLDISPYSTPSNSPFEPDLNNPSGNPSPASSYLSTPSPLPTSRTLSPESSVSISSPQPDGPDAERRPRKGDEGYIKRPENAFMLFRRKCCEDRQQADAELGGPQNRKKQRQADLSKTISQRWKSLSKKDRQYWEEMAEEKKRVHQEMYPDYVFRPQRVRDKDGKARNKKYTKRKRGAGTGNQREKRTVDTDGETAYFIPSPRSIDTPASSTPAPASYHTVHIPIISMVSPKLFSQSSHSLLAPQMPQTFSGTAGNITSDFDYLHSSDSRLRSEAGLQSSELMRNLFNLRAPETPESTGRLATRIQSHSLSPLSSVVSSPTSDPFTPVSDLVDQPIFNSAPLYPYPFNACGSTNVLIPQDPQTADIQADLVAQSNIVHSYPSWQSHDAIWQTETNILAGNDFDLQVIPPIELGQGMVMPEYGGDAVFGIAPGATLKDFDISQEYFLSLNGPMDGTETYTM